MKSVDKKYFYAYSKFTYFTIDFLDFPVFSNSEFSEYSEYSEYSEFTTFGKISRNFQKKIWDSKTRFQNQPVNFPCACEKREFFLLPENIIKMT